MSDIDLKVAMFSGGLVAPAYCYIRQGSELSAHVLCCAVLSCGPSALSRAVYRVPLEMSDT